MSDLVLCYKNEKVNRIFRLPANANDYYKTPYARHICHAVKGYYGETVQQDAIKKIAHGLMETGFIQKGDYIIPAPQHTGRATYMLDIANIIAWNTGANVLDILARTSSECICGKSLEQRNSLLDMYLIGEVPFSGKLIFIDNVMSTGTTYLNAKQLISNLVALPYAIDFNNFKILAA